MRAFQLLRQSGALLILIGFPGRAEEPAPFIGRLSLVRYDMPIGRSDGYAPTRQVARRKDEQDGVDWPNLTLNGRPLFRQSAEEDVELLLRQGADASSPFQMVGDDVIQPGNHWFRAMQWRRSRRHIYTADKTARAANSSAATNARYELWVFPILLKGEGGPVIKNVELKAGGEVVFKRGGPWRSLTLLLPASEPGLPYELSVDRRPAVKFEAGLMPVKLGTPREQVFRFEVAVPGDGPKITISNLARPEEFPHPKEWAADLAALASSLPVHQPVERGSSLRRYLGVETPYSPLTIYAAALPHGMSGGFFKKGTDAEAYAALLADSGYDAVFEQANAFAPPGERDSFERRAAALARHGVALGLQYDNNWTRPALQHPNVAFFSHTLPDWHAPLYRSLSLSAQRFARLPNFAGISVGSDNAGYVSSWHWAPPIPNRPWGEAMVEFMGVPQPRMPRAPEMGAPEFSFEVPVKTTEDFVKYVSRYDATFQQYGYFAEAVREVNPQLVFTTGAYGSSPGAGGRGGWPWASMPARMIHEGLNTQQAYDWNNLHSSKPMHNVALTDRVRSYHPAKRTWALVDNFQFLFGREAFQRAYALALTRGVQGIGTNFVAQPTGDSARPDVITWQKELHAWLRKYGGVYARMEPRPSIGVFYGHHQAVQRGVLAGEDLPLEKLLEGSHEGKVTEALFFCHAAGWPARVITYQEIMRGPLPPSMTAILLVGLNHVDKTWTWAPGLEAPLQQFIARGGRIIADEESICPVPCTRTAMRVAAYQPQSHLDATPLLFARNEANMQTLRAAMDGVAPPLVTTSSEKLWAIPAECGDTQYVTVVNQAFAEGAEASEMLRPADPKARKPEIWKMKGNASLFVKPQTGTLQWNTDRPIYDVRRGQKQSREEASTVDLTGDSFAWYALPPAEVVAPKLEIQKGVSGFFEAKITMHNGVSLNGIPVQVTVQYGDDSATVFSSTGATARLPLSDRDQPGAYTVTATELLTGLSTGTGVRIAASPSRSLQSGVVIREAAAVAEFATRKHVALTIALTPEQAKDVRLVSQADMLAAYYRQQGRVVAQKHGTVEPGGIVESLQPLRSPHRYPQWKTISSDLVLCGAPSNNVLLLDQARGQLFPREFALRGPGEADVLYTRSPFVGEYDVVNIVASDLSGIAAAVKTITSPAR